MGMIPDISDDAFEQEVLQADKPVLVDFWAPWCGPCKTMGALLETVAAERTDIKIVKLNIDENQEQAIAQRVMLLPTVILFKGGEVVGRLQGGVPPRAVNQLLDEHVGVVSGD
ncbi:MAG: thioredoxin [Thermomicrobiales bacterium]|nr:thioredoxin [Thermomicrobiales bacterium]